MYTDPTSKNRSGRKRPRDYYLPPSLLCCSLDIITPLTHFHCSSPHESGSQRTFWLFRYGDSRLLWSFNWLSWLQIDISQPPGQLKTIPKHYFNKTIFISRHSSMSFSILLSGCIDGNYRDNYSRKKYSVNVPLLIIFNMWYPNNIWILSLFDLTSLSKSSWQAFVLY